VARDEQILRAAVELFRERGYHAVGVDQIGERAGVTGPAIYRHFRSKDELLATLFDQAMDRLLLLMQDTPDDPWRALRALIEAQVRFVLADRNLLAVYVREDLALAEPYRRRFRRRQREHVERWIATVRACYPDAEEMDIKRTVHATLGMLLSAAHWPRDTLEPEGLEQHLVALASGIVAMLGGEGSAVTVGPAVDRGAPPD
jgi:AcrR family transcriptional regulator